LSVKEKIGERVRKTAKKKSNMLNSQRKECVCRYHLECNWTYISDKYSRTVSNSTRKHESFSKDVYICMFFMCRNLRKIESLNFLHWENYYLSSQSMISLWYHYLYAKYSNKQTNVHLFVDHINHVQIGKRNFAKYFVGKNLRSTYWLKTFGQVYHVYHFMQ